MRALVVSNAASGSADDATLEQVRGALSGEAEVEHLAAGSQDTFDEEVRSAARPGDLVVVAGGDGTINCVVNALADSLDEYTFGVVPMGTGNDFARTLGMDLDPAAAASQIAEGRTLAVDYGRASGEGIERLFLNGCMGGFPVEVDKAIEGTVKKRLGPFAFWVGGIKAGSDLSKFRVKISGADVDDVVAVGVGNGRTAGGGIEVWPDADPSDGSLNACAVVAANIAQALRVAVKTRSGDHLEMPETHASSGERIDIDSDPELEFNVDGEVLGLKTPASFLVAGKIKVRVRG